MSRGEVRGFRSDIQGLRAIAVGAVVLYHAGVPFLPGGYVGVDVFFVISGYLITAHLLSGLERDGRVHFASFYAKRARRILPASFLVLILSLVAALIWLPPLLMEEVWRGAVATALYVPNLLFAFDGTNYLAESTPSLFQHYWSLGIEEQFYLVWPAVLALGWVTIKSRRALFIALLLLVAISFVACVFLTFRQQPWAFFSLPTRAWELGIGGVVAFLLSRRRTVLTPMTAAIAGWTGLVGILVSVLVLDSATAFPGYWAALPVGATALVILAGATASRHGPTRALSMRGMLFVGTISYSLYLVHWPALIVPQGAVGFERPLPLWVTLSIAAACVPIAWMIYRFVEDPARNMTWLVRARPRRTLLGVVAGSMVCLAVAAGVFTISNARPLDAGIEAAPTVIAAPPTATSFVPSNLRPTLEGVSGDQPVVYADGCHLDFDDTDPRGCVYGDADAPRIMLFGDSHAAQWFPAVRAYAESNGYALESLTKSSCPSVSVTIDRDGVPYTACDEWRNAVLDRISAESPALVVLSNFGSAVRAAADPVYAALWGEGMERTLSRITTPVVVIADTPTLISTPSICLSMNIDDADACGRDRAEATNSPTRVAEAEAAARAGVPVVDLNDFICTETDCPPILGNTLVYRDAHHITATFSAMLSDPLGAAFRTAVVPG